MVGRQRRIAAITASKSKRGRATRVLPRAIATFITAVSAKMWKKGSTASTRSSPSRKTGVPGQHLPDVGA